MCSSANQAIVSTVLAEFIQSGRPFTAKDVTDEAKTRGANERHIHLKGAVHGEYGNGNLQAMGYDRSLVQLDGVTPDPWLYHQNGYNPQDYADNWNSNTGKFVFDAASAGSTATATATATQTATAPSSVATANGEDVELDDDGRVNIPRTLLKALGGKTLYAIASPGKVIVQSRPDSSAVASYTRNADGRVRISPKVLDAAGIKGGGCTGAVNVALVGSYVAITA